MVERPIKKSERQIAPPSDAGEETQETQPNTVEDNLEATTPLPEKRKVIPSVPGKEKTKARGKSSNREETASPPMNLALMRGPKPTRSKPPVAVTTPPEEVDSNSEPQSELEVDLQQ